MAEVAGENRKWRNLLSLFIIKLPLPEGQVPDKAKLHLLQSGRSRGLSGAKDPPEPLPQTKEPQILSQLAMLRKSQTMKVFRTWAWSLHPRCLPTEEGTIDAIYVPWENITRLAIEGCCPREHMLLPWEPWEPWELQPPRKARARGALHDLLEVHFRWQYS